MSPVPLVDLPHRHLLSQGRDPSGRLPGALLTLLGGSHPGSPLGTGDYLLRILYRADPTPPVPSGQEHSLPTRTTSVVQ